MPVFYLCTHSVDLRSHARAKTTTTPQQHDITAHTLRKLVRGPQTDGVEMHTVPTCTHSIQNNTLNITDYAACWVELWLDDIYTNCSSKQEIQKNVRRLTMSLSVVHNNTSQVWPMSVMFNWHMLICYVESKHIRMLTKTKWSSWRASIKQILCHSCDTWRPPEHKVLRMWDTTFRECTSLALTVNPLNHDCTSIRSQLKAVNCH